jgi:hypothetical protein
VLYDPSDHRKVAFDRPHLAQEAANRANHARLRGRVSRLPPRRLRCSRYSAPTSPRPGSRPTPRCIS